jgi:hypothetical protein
MRSRMRMFAGVTTFAGAALLMSSPAHSTMMPDPPDDESGGRFCCVVDTDGDRHADTWCCFNTGCTINSAGCRRLVQ